MSTRQKILRVRAMRAGSILSESHVGSAPFEIAVDCFGPRAWLNDLTCYNTLGMTFPVGHSSGVRESWQNVTGCSLQKGRDAHPRRLHCRPQHVVCRR